MAAPKKNQFWKQRSKHGRDALFATPELLWVAAEEYFQWCDDNPLIKVDFKGGFATRVNIPVDRPYTLAGFALYCDTSENWWQEFRKKATEDFLGVITRIEETIRQQKYSGAVVGIFNANIISRDLGLTEKHEHTGKDGKDLFPALDKLTVEQLEMLSALQQSIQAT